MVNQRQRDGIAIGALLLGMLFFAVVLLFCVVLVASLGYIFGAGLSNM